MTKSIVQIHEFQITSISFFKVALVYPNSDPLSFMCAFYGCVTAGVVPVPIEVPLTRRVIKYFCFFR